MEDDIHIYEIRHRGPLLDEARLRDAFEREFGVRRLTVGRTGDPNRRPEAGGETAYDYEIRWHGKTLDEPRLRGLLEASFGMAEVAVMRSPALHEAEAAPVARPRPWKPRLGSVADRVLAVLADGEERSWGALHAALREGPMRAWSGLSLALKTLVAEGRVARTGWGTYALSAEAGHAETPLVAGGAEARIMAALADGGVWRPSELRARTGMFPTRALERLVDKGLVERPADGLYRIASKGRDAARDDPAAEAPLANDGAVAELDAAVLACLEDGFTWSFAALKGRVGGAGLAVALSSLTEAGAIRRTEEGWCAAGASGGPAAPAGLTPALRRLLGALDRPMTVREAAAASGVSYAVAWEDLQRLVAMGAVRTLGESRRNRLYAVVDDEAAAAPSRKRSGSGFDYKTGRPISAESLRAAAAMRKLRRAGRWSQRDVAVRLGVSQTTVWAMENGMTEIHGDWIEAAAEMFGCPPQAFRGNREPARDREAVTATDDAGAPIPSVFTLSWDDGLNELCDLWELMELLRERGFGIDRIVEAITAAKAGGTFEVEDASAGRVATVGILPETDRSFATGREPPAHQPPEGP